MKRNLYLALLAVVLMALPAVAQTAQRPPAKDSQGQETNKTNRVVTALPVVEGDPDQPAKDRITVHQLKKKMDAKEEIIILDVRSRTAYLGSTVKIKGAVRMLPEQIEERRHELPKDKEIITYCT